MTTPAEKLAALGKLREAAFDDRTCADARGMYRGGCKECKRYSNKDPVRARRALKEMGFSNPFGSQEYPGALSVEQLGAAVGDEITDCSSSSTADELANCTNPAIYQWADEDGEEMKCEEHKDDHFYSSGPKLLESRVACVKALATIPLVEEEK